MKRKFLFILFPVILALAPSLCLANYSYPLMEGIPGFLNAGQTADFPTYLSALYKFGIWTIGLAALLMLSVGGFIYITSAGNNSQTGKAKGIITDAIIGVVMALVSWLLLYTINPDLVKFTPLTKLPIPAASTSATGGATSNNSQSAAQLAKNQADCSAYCAAGGSDTSISQSDCNSQCMAAKNAQGGTNTAGNGSGCGVLGAGQQMMGWTYTQGSQRMSDGYADCSSFASRAYTNAGCSNPGTNTDSMYQNAQTIQDQSSLQPGDIVVYRNGAGSSGHAAVCQNAGCSTIMAASSSHGQVITQNSSFMFNTAGNQPAKVLPASQYCPAGTNSC